MAPKTLDQVCLSLRNGFGDDDMSLHVCFGGSGLCQNGLGLELWLRDSLALEITVVYRKDDVFTCCDVLCELRLLWIVSI